MAKTRRDVILRDIDIPGEVRVELEGIFSRLWAITGAENIHKEFAVTVGDVRYDGEIGIKADRTLSWAVTITCRHASNANQAARRVEACMYGAMTAMEALENRRIAAEAETGRHRD